jgi:excisionase family DNA binding protein
MAADPLRATEAARLLGIPTRELLGLIYEHRIRYVMINGIAHVPVEAIDEYRAKAS